MTISSICVAGGGAMGIGVLRSFATSGISLTLLTRDIKAEKSGLPPDTRLIAACEGEAPDL